MKNQSNKDHQRLEGTIHAKLQKGWNCFTREEMEAAIALLHQSRRAKTAISQRLHTAHGDAVGWFLEDTIAFQDRPAPEGARNLFTKPPRLDFPRGWRVPANFRIHGFKTLEDGRLVQLINRSPMSPNDLMRRMHQGLLDISNAYKAYEAQPECSESEESK